MTRMRCLPLAVWLLPALSAVAACRAPQTPEEIQESRRLAGERWAAEKRARDSATIANAKPCQPPPLADTTGWFRIPRAHARYAILLPPSFTRDTSRTLRFEHGGERWADSTREFIEVIGFWGVESSRERPLCRMQMGGLPALVSPTSTAHPSVAARWLMGFGPLFILRSRDLKDRAILWTVLRTMADSTGVIPR